MNKVDDLETVLLTHDPHVVVITETWLHSGIGDNEVIPPCYRMIRKDRGSRGGGVAIIAKSSVDLVPLDCVVNGEVLWCKIKIHGNVFVVGAVYRPPNTAPRFLEELYDYMALHFNDKTKIILTGDFNHADIDWAKQKLGKNEIASSGLLLDIALSFNLQQLVDSPTRVTDTSQSILDLLFVSNIVEADKAHVLDGVSDHKMVFLDLELHKTAADNARHERTVRDFQNADDVSILDYLDEHFDHFSQLSDVTELWETFQSIVSYCTYHFVPTRGVRAQRHHPWVTREILQIKRKIKRKRKAKQNSSDIANLGRQLKNLISQARENYCGNVLSRFLLESPQKFWRFFSSKKEVITEVMVSDEVVSCPIRVAEEFNMYFQSVFTVSSDPPVDHVSSSDEPRMSDLVVSESGILNLLLNINVKKASGPDDISNAFLKRYAEWVSRYLFIIFQASLQQSKLPADWLCGKIIPIHKSGNKMTVQNYRPISLTSTCCKLLEHIISNHVTQYLEENNLIYKHQHGFRRGLSTVTQLIECAHEFSSVVNERGQVDVVFMDFSKAFDRVPHNKLIEKLHLMGLNSNIVSWVRSYLTNRTQYVYCNDACSTRLAVYSGVPQGSVLGPLLFLLYINDIADDMPPAVQVKLFADDCMLFSNVRTVEDQDLLNASLEKLYLWCERWGMVINFDKTVFCSITNKRNILEYSYNIGGVQLRKVDEFKYLGVIFSSTMQWNSHVDYVCSKAYKKLLFLRRQLRHANSDVRKLAYMCYVRPLLEYASIVWDPYRKCHESQIERIQNLALRFIFSRYKRTESVSSMRQEAQLDSLAKRRKISRLKELFSITTGMTKLDPQLYLRPSTSRSQRTSNVRAIAPYQYKNDVFKYSFFCRTIVEWNALPNEVVSCCNLKSFESSLREFLTE